MDNMDHKTLLQESVVVEKTISVINKITVLIDSIKTIEL